VVRLERSAGGLAVASRLARPHVLGILGGVLGLAALAVRRPAPHASLALLAAALLVVALGGRSVRATVGRGRVRVRPAIPLARAADRALAEFLRAEIETVGEARARRAERLAHGYRERSGAEMPPWLRPAPVPGTNDHLRRVVLVPLSGEPLAVTAWLAPEDDLEPLRAELAALLG
jgi:hypothetical protein